LKSLKIFAKKYSAGSRSGSGVPDIIGCRNGKFFGIEVKYGSKVSEVQKTTGAEIQEAGGEFYIVTCQREAEELIKIFAEEMKKCTNQN
jgi:hypothetical protein